MKFLSGMSEEFGSEECIHIRFKLFVHDPEPNTLHHAFTHSQDGQNELP
jgi:hypothetical protein